MKIVKVKDLQIKLRPRERLKECGVSSLSDDELLAIILRSGSKEKNVKELASDIINYIGSINNFENATLKELTKINGVGEVKSMEILAAIEFGKRVLKKDNSNIIINNNLVVYDMFKYNFVNTYQEKFIALFLDNQKKLITYNTIFIGTLSYASVHPREVFKLAIKNSASAIIVVHNHPSGNSKPSNADVEITDKLVEVGKIMGIPVIDHIIIGNKNYYSFYDQKKVDIYE